MDSICIFVGIFGCIQIEGPVLNWLRLVQTSPGLIPSPGLVWTEDRTAVLGSPLRTAVPVPVLMH